MLRVQSPGRPATSRARARSLVHSFAIARLARGRIRQLPRDVELDAQIRQVIGRVLEGQHLGDPPVAHGREGADLPPDGPDSAGSHLENPRLSVRGETQAEHVSVVGGDPCNAVQVRVPSPGDIPRSGLAGCSRTRAAPTIGPDPALGSRPRRSGESGPDIRFRRPPGGAALACHWRAGRRPPEMNRANETIAVPCRNPGAGPDRRLIRADHLAPGFELPLVLPCRWFRSRRAAGVADRRGRRFSR